VTAAASRGEEDVMQRYASYPSLMDRVVFVTGGGSGIGGSIVEHFCAQGARVAFVDIDRPASEARVAAVGARGHPAPWFISCDLRDIAALRAAVAEARARLGPIRVLVNNAANDERHPIDRVTPEYWDDRFAVNLRHQFFAAQAVYPDMAAAGGGSIVNLGSTSWVIGQGGMPGYTTAKSAVAGLTRALARDLGPMNIRVNCILPGWIMTERQIRMWLTPDGEAELLRRQCLKRKLGPEEIARVVLFFAADDSEACTNQSYIADGGWV
jgi:NAD(P)-dependent dehydrogenase (short-subunit alcohol dehydrogenase family)